MILQALFWSFLFIIFYCYVGYTLILWVISKFHYRQPVPAIQDYLPDVTLLIASYNEKELLKAKLENTRNIAYLTDKLHVIWVTDGSNDGSPELLKKEQDIAVLHEPERKGKTAAINRAMGFVNTQIVVYSDANTLLNAASINEIVALFNDPKTGCVAGEKRIEKMDADKATGAGEGFYWRYESFTKKLESDVNSTVGAAGELFAIRTALFRPVPEDTVLDDFVISIAVIREGYRIRYTPDAYSVESSSETIKDELKRKIRIAAGATQVLGRYPDLMNPFRLGFFSLQYFSHKVLRWTLVPFAFIAIFIINAIIITDTNAPGYFIVFFVFQSIGYMLALLGFVLQEKQIKWKIIFLPFYLISMNYAIIAGIIRYFKKDQVAAWEKAKRRIA